LTRKKLRRCFSFKIFSVFTIQTWTPRDALWRAAFKAVGEISDKGISEKLFALFWVAACGESLEAVRRPPW
jgi:hypothetical protein